MRLGIGALVMRVWNSFDEYSFFFSSRRRHTRFDCDWSSDVCSSDLHQAARDVAAQAAGAHSARLPTAVPRATRQMRRRAQAFTITVMTNSTRPTSNMADRKSVG